MVVGFSKTTKLTEGAVSLQSRRYISKELRN